VRRRRAGRLHLNAEINVVSLIDVMMLLLVIFMITAPLMQGGIDVKLPVADAKPLENKSSLVISINRAGLIFIDGDTVTYREFAASFKALVGAKPSTRTQGVTIQADARADWQSVAQVLAVVRSAGVTSVGMSTEPEPPR
jgi:biopolymer transport protein TolR